MASSSIIGLDIGTTGVRAAELSYGRGGPTSGPLVLERYAEVALPPGAVRHGEVVEQGTVSSAIRQLWSRGKFGSRKVLLGVGNQRVVVREAELPWMPMDQLRMSLPYQQEEVLMLSAEDVLLDFFPTAENDTPQGRMVRGLFVGASRDTVSANVLAAEAGNLTVEGVDLSAFAIFRSAARSHSSQGCAAYIEVGARLSQIVIATDGAPRLVRTVPIGAQDFTDAIVNVMRISGQDAEQMRMQAVVGGRSGAISPDANEAVNEVASRFLDTVRSTFLFFHNANPATPVRQVVLTGGGVHQAGFGQTVATVVNVPVTLGNPLEGVTVSKNVDPAAVQGRESTLAQVVGLGFGVAA